MPIVDKPLRDLYSYRGTNPRPANFDTYWDEALAEMHAVDPAMELVPVGEPWGDRAECFDLYFTGVRGARIHAKYARPKQRPQRLPAVVSFHGYSASSGGWWDRLAWAGAGFCTAAMDCRGQGGLSGDVGGHKGYTLSGHVIRGLDGDPHDMLMRHIFLDGAQLARVVMEFEEVDPDRVGAEGWSQGGGLALACSALEPRVKRCASVYPFLSDYQRVWEMDLAKDAYRELSDYFRRFDPRHEREQEVFQRLGLVDIQHLAPRVEARVLMAVGLMDTVCPPSTQYAAYNKIPSQKEILVYPDFGHESLPGVQDAILRFLSDL